MSKSNNTWAGMIALNLRVTVYCDPCNRSIELDLEKMPPDGNAIGVKFRCNKCGRFGRSIVSPATNDQNTATGIVNWFIGPFPRPVIYTKRRRRR